jgi:HPt (histidine-containing phosphotransfer) domain-containing protein
LFYQKLKTISVFSRVSKIIRDNKEFLEVTLEPFGETVYDMIIIHNKSLQSQKENYWGFQPISDLTLILGDSKLMNNELPFSMETLMEQCGGMTSVVVSVLDAFLEQVPTDTNEMETCLANGDLLTVSKAAHRLKGTAGILGASKLHPLCAALELAGKQGNADEAAKIYNELKTEAQLCIDAVPAAKAKF